MTIYEFALSQYRKVRVLIRRLIGAQPTIRVSRIKPIKYYGNKGYGGWGVPSGYINAESTIVDAGLGEDISFSESLIAEFSCIVHGFDPTPRSIAYVKSRNLQNFRLHQFGLAGSNRGATFFLPNNDFHISGSVTKTAHVGDEQIEVDLVDIERVFSIIDKRKIDILKIDIEGAEYELFQRMCQQNSDPLRRVSP